MTELSIVKLESFIQASVITVILLVCTFVDLVLTLYYAVSTENPDAFALEMMRVLLFTISAFSLIWFVLNFLQAFVSFQWSRGKSAPLLTDTSETNSDSDAPLIYRV